MKRRLKRWHLNLFHFKHVHKHTINGQRGTASKEEKERERRGKERGREEEKGGEKRERKVGNRRETPYLCVVRI